MFKGKDISIDGTCGKQPDDWRREDPFDCISLCKSVEGCNHFSWISPEYDWNAGRKRCCLKKGTPVPEKTGNLISAVLAYCEGIKYIITSNRVESL